MSSPGAGDSGNNPSAKRQAVGTNAPSNVTLDPKDVQAVQAFIQTDDSSAHSQALNHLLVRVHQRKLDLKQLVILLGPALTNQQEQPRLRGTLLLAELLTRLPELVLTPLSITTFVEFFTQRLKDESCLKEVLMGLRALTLYHALPRKSVSSITAAIFQQLTVQSLSQGVRKTVFDIIGALLSKYEQDIVAQGEIFIAGWIQAMDGEKDPRNLVSCFNILDTILSRFPSKAFSAHHLQELWEISSCYFPITFTAPKSDPYGITNEDLKNGLKKCLCSPQFRPLVEELVTIVNDRVDEPAMSTKLDALELLRQGFVSFGPTAFQPHMNTVWSLLKRQAVSSTDNTFVDATLRTIGSVVESLYPETIAGFVVQESVVQSALCEKFVGPLVADFIQELRIPDTKLARTYARIVTESMVSPGAATALLDSIWQPFREKLKSEHLQPNQYQALLEFLAAVVVKVRRFGGETLKKHPLQAYFTECYAIFLDAQASSSTKARNVALSAACVMATLKIVPAPLSKEQLESLATTVVQNIFHPDSEVRDVAVACLLDLFANLPQVDMLLSVLTPRLFSATEFSGEDVQAPKVSQEFALALEVTGKLASVPAALQVCLGKLLSCIRVRLPRVVRKGVDEDIVKAVLQSTSELVSFSASTSTLEKEARPLCLTILGTLISSLLHSPEPRLYEGVVAQCADILSHLVRTATDDDQQFIFNLVTTVFVDGNLEPISEFTPPKVAFAPFTDASSQQEILLPVFTAIIGAHRPTFTLPRLKEILQTLTSYTKHVSQRSSLSSSFLSSSPLTESSDPSTVVLQALASVLNKLPADAVQNILDEIWSFQLPIIRSDSAQSTRLSALKCIAWLAKGLIPRRDCAAIKSSSGPIESFVCGFFVECLKDSDLHIAKLSAAGFDLLLTDTTLVLSKETHSNVGPLYKQRLFTRVLPVLLEEYQKLPQTSLNKGVFLLALGYLISRVPEATLLEEIRVVLPLMVQALASPLLELRVTTMYTLTQIIPEASEAISEHASSIIPQLLELSGNKGSVKVRLLALKCLETMLAVPYHRLHPLRGGVLRQLAVALDDPKQLVRQQARRTRNLWFSLQSTPASS